MGLEAQQRALAAQFGVPEAMFVEGMQRGLQVRGDGTFLRPDPGGLGAEIYASLDEVNMFDLYREISCARSCSSTRSTRLAVAQRRWGFLGLSN